MTLLALQNISFSIGQPLLENVDLGIEAGERICVVGRNGAGKSTLLRIIAGEATPDEGNIQRSPGLVVARLEQEVPGALEGSVFSVVAAGLGELGAYVAEYHGVAASLDGAQDEQRLADLHARIDAADGWDLERRVASVLSRVQLDGDASFTALSGGLKRRVLLARALVTQPDILLLDEPTNHLDIAAIAWLEELVRGFAGAVVFITHDRSFLRALATRIVEIDRGQVTSWPGDYANYLRRREERLHAEELADAQFDKRLAQEEVWIRQGIKARRTRNEGRVRALQAMRRERAQRRSTTGNASMRLVEGERSGRLVIRARNMHYNWGDNCVVDDFSTTVMRGDRIGIIGPNGSGKTTLIRLLLGQLQPDRGEVQTGTGLQLAWFDQHRSALRDDLSIIDNVADGREFIELGGTRKHIIGYLQDFLFSPERARAPIERLSGGERNRLMLAKLFAQPSNLLVMDEPTNDLDIETLELLEDLLADYAGTLLLVSHDRAFLDAVVTSTIVLEGDGKIEEYVGGYSDWLRQRPAEPAPQATKPRRQDKPPPRAAPKLGFRETRELAALPGQIESLEQQIAEQVERMGEPEFYTADSAAIVSANEQLAALQQTLQEAYQRWEELESLTAPPAG